MANAHDYSSTDSRPRAALDLASRTSALTFHTPEQHGRANSTALGRWVYDHQRQFSQDNPLAWYGIRNVANNIVSIVGLMATIVPTRMGMGHIAKWADGRGMQKTQQFFSNTVLQNSLGVGVSFATFRTLYKMGQRAYSRVFIKPEDAEETTQAIADLPKNWANDFLQAAPAEFPATMIASTALVGIRSAFTPSAPELPKNQWKDVTACALLAYPVFFEITEHLGRRFQLARGYRTNETNEHIDKDKQTFGELLTRQVPGVAAGIVPYIAVNNIWYRKTGRQLSYNSAQVAKGVHEIDGYWKAFWKERPYEVFWMFSLGRDVYFDLYDKITGRARKVESQGVERVQRKSHAFATDSASTEHTAEAEPAGQVSQVELLDRVNAKENIAARTA